MVFPPKINTEEAEILATRAVCREDRKAIGVNRIELGVHPVARTGGGLLKKWILTVKSVKW